MGEIRVTIISYKSREAQAYRCLRSCAMHNLDGCIQQPWGKIKLKNKLEPAYGSLELYSKIVRILSCSQSFYTEKCDVQNDALR